MWLTIPSISSLGFGVLLVVRGSGKQREASREAWERAEVVYRESQPPAGLTMLRRKEKEKSKQSACLLATGHHCPGTAA